jgi:hypothetical protein
MRHEKQSDSANVGAAPPVLDLTRCESLPSASATGLTFSHERSGPASMADGMMKMIRFRTARLW